SEIISAPAPSGTEANMDEFSSGALYNEVASTAKALISGNQDVWRHSAEGGILQQIRSAAAKKTRCFLISISILPASLIFFHFLPAAFQCLIDADKQRRK